MKTIPAIFDLLGGIASVSQILDIKYGSAKEMKRREVIPVWHWQKLIDGCKDKGVRGVNPTVLMNLHTKDGK